MHAQRDAGAEPAGVSALLVGDVVARTAVTHLVAAARERGCRTAAGTQMYDVVQRLTLDFLLSRNDSRDIT
ncbi:hypothetical protein ACLRDC_16135 [Gluconacetobacter sacchari]|uniref:Uncharacterized protein n=1 Tax=Gluconacetobacter sacchari TaxID=92759 RepID=A0A7W4IF05_9PROT|nr:hypothetical protein [Gluconacetobacter sacchari]MBB2161635.1 hypothetical protein [Gluconacetobacter sacchari]